MKRDISSDWRPSRRRDSLIAVVPAVLAAGILGVILGIAKLDEGLAILILVLYIFGALPAVLLQYFVGSKYGPIDGKNAPE